MSKPKLFEVKEIRSYYATYQILAEDEEQAGHLKGEIQDESHSDCWGVELVHVHETD